MAKDEALGALLERDRIAQVLNTLFTATDAREWHRVQSCFAPRVKFDMTSLAGGAPQELSPADIATGWESGLKPIDALHHQTGNLSVTPAGTEASASCYGIAYHYRRNKSGRHTRVFVGSYDFHLVLDGEWRIDEFRFNLKFLDGNLQLEQEERA